MHSKGTSYKALIRYVSSSTVSRDRRVTFSGTPAASGGSYSNLKITVSNVAGSSSTTFSIKAQ